MQAPALRTAAWRSSRRTDRCLATPLKTCAYFVRTLRHTPAPQPGRTPAPRPPWPSPPALVSRSSAASWGRSFSGLELVPRPARLQISSPAAQDAWGKGVDQQHSPASFCLKRLSRAIEEGGPAKSSGAAQLRRAASRCKVLSVTPRALLSSAPRLRAHLVA